MKNKKIILFLILCLVMVVTTSVFVYADDSGTSTHTHHSKDSGPYYDPSSTWGQHSKYYRCKCGEAVDRHYESCSFNTSTVKAATCTTTGTSRQQCSDCGASRDSTIAALGHNYSGAWQTSETQHWKICARSGCSETLSLGSHVDTANGGDGYCDTCNRALTKAITASVSGGNGTISPDGEVIVSSGADQTFTFSPSTNYTIKSLLVDSAEQTTTGTSRQTLVTNGYTFSSVTATHTITVTYGLDYDGNYIPDDEEPDIEAPTGTIAIQGAKTLQDGISKGINTRNVTLTITASDNKCPNNLLQMAIINENEVETLNLASKWQAFSETPNWTLSAGEGWKTVYLVLKDNSGNVSVVPTPST